MGSKGNIEKGGHRRDYDMVTWSDTTNFIFIDQIIFIEKESGIVLSPSLKLKLRDEINQYNSMVQMQNIARHKGGSGRVNDFFAAHIRALAKIFEDSGGKIEFKRAKKIDSPGEESHSQFSYFLRAINDIYPNDLKHKGDGIVNSSRKILYETIYYR